MANFSSSSNTFSKPSFQSSRDCLIFSHVARYVFLVSLTIFIYSRKVFCMWYLASSAGGRFSAMTCLISALVLFHLLVVLVFRFGRLIKVFRVIYGLPTFAIFCRLLGIFLTKNHRVAVGIDLLNLNIKEYPQILSIQYIWRLLPKKNKNT